MKEEIFLLKIKTLTNWNAEKVYSWYVAVHPHLNGRSPKTVLESGNFKLLQDMFFYN